jgi:hypothetical protein
MPKFKCLCGENINLSPIPNPQGFNLIWEPLIEILVNDLVIAYKKSSSEQGFENQVYELIHLKTPRFPQVYECCNCKRLTIFKNASDSEPIFWYERESISEDKFDLIVSLLKQSYIDENKFDWIRSLI